MYVKVYPPLGGPPSLPDLLVIRVDVIPQHVEAPFAELDPALSHPRHERWPVGLVSPQFATPPVIPRKNVQRQRLLVRLACAIGRINLRTREKE